MDWIVEYRKTQGVFRKPATSYLSLWERVRVRAFDGAGSSDLSRFPPIRPHPVAADRRLPEGEGNLQTRSQKSNPTHYMPPTTSSPKP